MFNKDNVFITVNEEVSSIIQQYIIREIKKVLDKYKSIVTEEISSVEKLIKSIRNEELKEEFLNDWSMSVKIAKEIGENEVDDRIISKITINELREVDSINLTINDKLVDYISKEEGVSIKDAPSSFMLRNVGMSVLNLDIVI